MKIVFTVEFDVDPDWERMENGDDRRDFLKRAFRSEMNLYAMKALASLHANVRAYGVSVSEAELLAED